jgi:subtilisin-like proprotein convertase family protein
MKRKTQHLRQNFLFGFLVRQKQRLFKTVFLNPQLARIWFLPTSSQPLGVSCRVTRRAGGNFFFLNLQSEEINFMSGLSNPFCASLSQMVRVRTLFAALAFLIFVSATQTIVAQTTLTFSNPAQIDIPDFGTATPYPSNITVAGFAAGQTITKVNVTLTGFSHTFPRDVGVLLVSPAGTSVNLTAACGGGRPGVANSNLTFDDAAATNVPTPPVTGTYKPTQCLFTPYLPPAPPAPYGTTLAATNGGTPNGVWKLFVRDFFQEDAGEISGGYSLTITAASVRTRFDFDGDGRADLSVFRPSDRTWYLNQSTNGLSATQFGLSTDKITPADYDGDGRTDVAVFREGVWYLQRSSLGFTAVAFGAATDIPTPADFDADGKAEIAVFRPANGTWYIYNLATNQATGFAFGQSGDIPVAADYDADGKDDIAVFRGGIWYVQRSSLGFIGIAFGAATDKPVPADYDGDGKTDVAVFRPDNGVWYLMRSNLGITEVQFGFGTDTPVPADYDGDGKADVAVFRDGTWYLQRSQAGFTGIAFGNATDKPVPNAFVP